MSQCLVSDMNEQANSENQVEKSKLVGIGCWYYTKPDLIPDKDGNIVLVQKVSFGPLESYAWGLDSDGNAYERYQWLENEFYAYESYCIIIEKEKLLEQIQSVISLFQNNGLTEWAEFYADILLRLFRPKLHGLCGMMDYERGQLI